MICFCPQGAARNPNDANEQEKLKKAAEDLRAATNAAASNALKKKLVLRLEVPHLFFSAVSFVSILFLFHYIEHEFFEKYKNIQYTQRKCTHILEV